ncbi:hypothetical protein BRADI_1g05116v3 [Brachypodium distachyon]|uniref:FAD synthase n=1 Tax=Brachypodium distachyon TaxID=15368 RepID=A0A2K2DI55_BRADI|nr:hypothetical protein BRADI_1g05116v3 [Brachypodium distachyon]
MERGGAALACAFRSPSPYHSPPSQWPPPLLRGRHPPASASAGVPRLLPPRGWLFSQIRLLDTSKGLSRCSLKTFSSFGHPRVSLNNEDIEKDKILIDCGEDQDCVLGENYRFGYKASGDAAELVKLCEEFGLSAFIVRSVMDTAKRSYNGATPPVNSTDKGQVSSSRVRHALSVGDMEYVSKLLGRKHRLVLTVNECCLQEREKIVFPKSCMLNMPPADGFYENCGLVNGGYLGLCRVTINSETIDIELEDKNSLTSNLFREDQQLGIEFG